MVSANDAARVSADASKETKETKEAKYGETADDVCTAVLNNENAAAPGHWKWSRFQPKMQHE